jgi:hypothetical protein
MQEESEDDIESGQEDIRETKRPCRKDEVVVVVDGREFVEGIQRLRESSGYFAVQPPSWTGDTIFVLPSMGRNGSLFPTCFVRYPQK